MSPRLAYRICSLNNFEFEMLLFCIEDWPCYQKQSVDKVLLKQMKDTDGHLVIEFMN